MNIAEDAPERLVHFLKDEGYVVRRGEQSRSALSADGADFARNRRRLPVSYIEESRTRCVPSVTGDVDSMTLIDFLEHSLEV